MHDSLLLLSTYGVVERVRNMFNLADMEHLTEMGRILSDLESVYPLLFGCITSGSEQAKDVAYWLQELSRIVYHVGNEVENEKLYSGSIGGSIIQSRNCISNLQAVAESYKATDSDWRVFRFHPGRFAGRILSRAASPRYYGGIFSLPEGETIVQLDSKKEEIIKWIFNDDKINECPKVLIINGDEGVGKTTLAKMIYNDPAFQASASFHNSQPTPAPYDLGFLKLKGISDLKGILVEIIMCFINERVLQWKEVDTLKHKLRDILAVRRYILVLDDYEGVARETSQVLMEIFEEGLVGSTVIIVSTERMPIHMPAVSEHWTLESLPEFDSWSLFAQCAGFDEEAAKKLPTFLTSIGESIVAKCKGFPLAIKTMGRMLRTNRDELFWKEVNAKWAEKEGADTAVRNAFLTSLQHLSANLLQCLHECTILLNSYDMPKDTLIHYWMGLGLLQSWDGNEEEDPIDVGNRNCDELEFRCFLQLFQTYGRPMVSLHPQVTSLLGSIGELEFPNSTTDLLSEAFPRHVIWRGDYMLSNISPVSDLTNVRTLWCKRDTLILDKFFLNDVISKLHHVRILSLVGPGLEKLPDSIGELQMLRYLSVVRNYGLKELPDSVCSLRNLQTLDLSGCYQLLRLPENMDTLISLRHLFLSIELPNVPKLTQLHHLRICSSPTLYPLSDKISYLTALRVLQIHDCPYIASLPNSIKDLTSLTELSILNCEKMDLANWEGLGGLGGLQYLQIEGLPALTEFPEGFESAANSLQHLVVRNCQTLKALPKDLQDCRVLLEMVIDNCPELTAPEVLKIKTLQVTKILNCPKLIPQTQTIPASSNNYSGHSGAGSNSLASTMSSEAGQSSGQPSHNLQKTPDEEVVREASVMEKSNDPRFIFFLIPEDYEIEKDTLIRLWMATGSIKDEQHGEKRFRSFSNIGYLSPCGTNSTTGRFMYQINTEKKNKLLLSVIGNSSFYLQWKKEDQPNPDHVESMRHVSLGDSTEIDAKTFEAIEKFTNLRSVLFFGNSGHRAIQMPRHLFSSFSKLEALDLSRTHLEKLPSSIRHMSELRYLDLSWTLIELLPDILCSLVQLQTLRLIGCYNLTMLPEKLHQLTNLRHIDFDVLGQLDVMPTKMGELKDLRTLPAFLAGTEDGRNIQELSKLNKLSGELCIANLENVRGYKEAEYANLIEKKQLKKLELRWTSSEICGTHNNSEDILDYLQPFDGLEELQISCYEGEVLPGWVENPEYWKLVSIVFYRCENLGKAPAVEKLPYLKHLQFVKMNSVTKFTAEEYEDAYWNGVLFPKLEKLEINEMKRLEIWEWKNSQKGDFSSLTHLIIEDCPSLVKFDVFPHLPSIRFFEMRNCPKLETLSDSKLPDSLEKLIVDECPQIQKRCLEGNREDWHKIEDVPYKSIQEVNEDEGQAEHVPNQSSQEVNEDKGPAQHVQNRSIQEVNEEEGPAGARSISLVSTVTLEAGQSSQQAPHNLRIISDEEVVREASMMEKSNDPHFIFFLLPEDHEIEEDTLIRLWMAAGSIKDEQEGVGLFRSFSNIGYLSPCGTNSTTGRFMYQINTEKKNKLLLSVIGNSSFYLQWKKEDQPNPDHVESMRHVSLGDSTEIDAKTFEAIAKFTNLRSVLFFGNSDHKAIQMPRHLFSSFSKLEALDLSSTYLEKLPSSIRHMSELRYLDLSWTLIQWLPDILCSLVQLQTLRLRGCYNLTVLPEKLHQLTNLRHIDFDMLGQLDAMPTKMGELKALRTLSAFLVGTEDGHKIQELSRLNELSGELCIANLENVRGYQEAKEANLLIKVQLKKLELRWTSSEICGTHNNSHSILDYLEPFDGLEEFQISCYEGKRLPRWIKEKKWELVSIVFYRCENLSKAPVVEKLPNLKHLQFVKMNSVTILEVEDADSHVNLFPKLEKLEINEMKSLEIWEWKNSQKGDFSSLTHLIIEDCPNLVKFDVLAHLPSIKFFEMRNCPKLETLSDRKLSDSLKELMVDECPQIQKKCVMGNGEDWHKIEHVPYRCI